MLSIRVKVLYQRAVPKEEFAEGMKNRDQKLMEGSWQQMRTILDKEMPVTPERKPRGIYMWSILAAVSIVGILWFERTAQQNEQPQLPQVADKQEVVLGKSEPVSDLKAIVTTRDINPPMAETAQSKAEKSTVVEAYTQYTQSTRQLSAIPSSQQIVAQVAVERTTSSAVDHVKGTSTASSTETLQTVALVDNKANDQVSTQVIEKFTAQSQTPEIQQIASISPSEVSSDYDYLAFESPKPSSPTNWRFGLQSAIGSNLLPLPSSVSLAVVGQFRLAKSYSILSGFGLDQLYLGESRGKIVEVNQHDLSSNGVNPNVATYISQRVSDGNPVKLHSAQYWSFFTQINKHFSKNWVAGLGLKYQTLGTSKISQESNEMLTNSGPSILTSPTIQSLSDAYNQIAELSFAKKNVSVQINLQYAVNQRFRFGLTSQNALTKRNPEPSSLQLTATYLPF